MHPQWGGGSSGLRPLPLALIKGPVIGPIKGLTSFWVGRALGNMLTSIVSNSHFGKRPVARDMTICGSHFLPHVT